MNTRSVITSTKHRKLVLLLAIWPMIGFAQAPVDDSGNPVGEYYAQDATSNDADLVLITPAELQELVGSIALYPDDLLAIILPASTYPLQLVEASRFLENLKSDPTLQPDDDWDDSVVALINYPEVIELLNADLDWTWQLGEAVVAQQADVISAIEVFRDRAYAAGNLKTDEYQEVTTDDGIIEITPVNDEIIYVPYYEPERVVVYQPQPVYYYHPQPYPVYYYPYPYGHSFRNGFFWGVTTAFTIGWATDYLNVYHHSYYGHPYYSYTYNNSWWYRRPSINVYNSYYANDYRRRTDNHYQNGDRWHSNNNRRLESSGRQVTRTRYQSGTGNQVARDSTPRDFTSSSGTTIRSGSESANTASRKLNTRTERDARDRNPSGEGTSRQQVAKRTVQPNGSRSNSGNDIQFRDRGEKSTTDRERINNTGTRSGQTNISNSTTRTATARIAPESKIRFEPRADLPPATTTRNTSNNSPRSSSSRQSTLVARTTSATTTRSSGQRNVAAASRASSTPARSSTARVQAEPRVEKRAAPRQQSQRQAAPTQQKSQSGSSKSRSGSGGNSKSESGSRSSKSESGSRSSNNRSGSNNRQTR